MSSKRYRGRFVWQPPEKLSFQGTPQNRDQWFELSREQLLTMWRDFKGLPIRQLHGSVPIGRVLSPFWDADGSAMIEFELDNTPEANFTRSLLDNNLMRGLSLKHNPNSTYPIEMSLCFEGARPNTWVTGVTETKGATYKPTDTFMPVDQQSLELLAETTSTVPMQQQTSHVAASMQQIPMQTVAQSVAQGQSPVCGYVPPPGVADPMYQQQQQQPPPQQQQQQQPPPADNDSEMMDLDEEPPALDEIIKAIVEKRGALSAKEKVLLLKSMEKTKRQVETATSELQEQQQQNNQLKSHYLDAILGWIERSSGTSTDEGDRQSLNTLFNSPEGAKFLASSTGNRFLVSASKAALVPELKTKEQIEEERYNKYLTRMLQQTQAPGTSVARSVAASSSTSTSSSKPPVQNVQAANSFLFTPDEFKHAFAAPLHVSTSSLANSGNLQPVRPYLSNVAASASGSAINAPPAKTFYTSAELGWKYVPGSIKIPAFTKELLDASRTRALDQVDMTVVVPRPKEQRTGLFANSL